MMGPEQSNARLATRIAGQQTRSGWTSVLPTPDDG
jgi:hypothetical protein